MFPLRTTIAKNLKVSKLVISAYQAHNQGGRSSPTKFYTPLEKCVDYSLKIWAPFRKLFTPFGVPSWLRA